MLRGSRGYPICQITGLENGTEYYVRVSAYNGPGGENSTTSSTETFTTYGAPAVATPFPVTTVEQVDTASVLGPIRQVLRKTYVASTICSMPFAVFMLHVPVVTRDIAHSHDAMISPFAECGCHTLFSQHLRCDHHEHMHLCIPTKNNSDVSACFPSGCLQTK